MVNRQRNMLHQKELKMASTAFWDVEKECGLPNSEMMGLYLDLSGMPAYI